MSKVAVASCMSILYVVVDLCGSVVAYGLLIKLFTIYIWLRLYEVTGSQRCARPFFIVRYVIVEWLDFVVTYGRSPLPVMVEMIDIFRSYILTLPRYTVKSNRIHGYFVASFPYFNGTGSA